MTGVFLVDWVWLALGLGFGSVSLYAIFSHIVFIYTPLFFLVRVVSSLFVGWRAL